MKDVLEPKVKDLYDQDFYGWTARNAELLRTGRMNEFGRFEDGPDRIKIDARRGIQSPLHIWVVSHVAAISHHQVINALTGLVEVIAEFA